MRPFPAAFRVLGLIAYHIEQLTFRDYVSNHFAPLQAGKERSICVIIEKYHLFSNWVRRGSSDCERDRGVSLLA
jgi:hypothetical protein